MKAAAFQKAVLQRLADLDVVAAAFEARFTVTADPTDWISAMAVAEILAADLGKDNSPRFRRTVKHALQLVGVRHATTHNHLPVYRGAKKK